MDKITKFLLFMLLAAGVACVPYEEQLFKGDASLSFSKDTVYFDTVFTEKKSITRRLQVYNPEKKAVIIEKIEIRGLNSPFSMRVNGFAAKKMENIKILGGDSLLILLDATLPNKNSNSPLLIEDVVDFKIGGRTQEVYLNAWGQDVFFIEKGYIKCGTVWENKRPYVVLDTLAVAKGCEFTIKKGANIHFAPGASLFVAGTLIVEGTPDSLVTFQGLRIEKTAQDYTIEAPGQWGGIFFLLGSKSNKLKSAKVVNSFNGIYIGTPDDDDIPELTIESSFILNTASNAFTCASSDVVLVNSVLAKCIGHNIVARGGGNYIFYNNTLVNHYNYFTRNNVPVAAFTNFLTNNQQRVVKDLYIEFVNNVLWGDLEDELILMNDPAAKSEIIAQSNLIKTAKYAVSFKAEGNIVNADPKFVNLRKVDFLPDSLSPLIGAASVVDGLTKDIKGNKRGLKPDIGAYERLP